MASPLRVAMVAPPPGNCGVGDYADLLLRELRKSVEVVAVAPPDRFDPALNEADVVHVQHEYFLFGGVAPWRVRTGAYLRQITRPIVLTAHEFVDPAGPVHRNLAIRLSNRLHFGCPRVRRILVHTEADRRRIERWRPSPAPVAVVRHPVFGTPTLPDREQARAALGVCDRTVVTLLGFLSRRKGHRLALEALAHCSPDTLLLMAGGKHPNDQTGYVEELVRDARPWVDSQRARITGYLEEEAILQVLAATDVILAPFEVSSGSGSLSRAFACGLPIVASDIEPHREIAGIVPEALALFHAGDAKDLARVLSMAAADPQYRARIAEGSHDYAAANSMARIAEQTVQVYRDVVLEAG